MAPRASEEPPPPPPQESEEQGQRYVRPKEWGFDVHVFGAFIGGGDADSDAGIGGVGIGLRYRPIPHLAIDGNVEFAFGTDYNGFERNEVVLLGNAVGFLNPRSVVTVYALAGLGVAVAYVSLDALPDGGDQVYSYFGGQLGGGAEIRVSRRTAIHAEIIGFLRTRTDGDRDSRPEFIDPDSHRTSNTSGGAVLRGGVLFYW